MALVAADKSYDITLTSTAPETLRFRVLNSDPSFKIRLSMYYTQAERIDAYTDGKHIIPTNAEKDSKGDILTKEPVPLRDYMPTYRNKSGTNMFLKSESRIYLSVDGLSTYDLKIAPVLVVSFGLPPITPDEFFKSENVVNNFALLLGIPASKIRRVEIVRATQTARIISGKENIVKIIMEENAVESLNDTQALNDTQTEFKKLNAKITNLFSSNQLQEKAQETLNVTLTSVTVEFKDAPVILQKVGKIEFIQQADDCSAQAPCTKQPIIRVLDDNVRTKLEKKFTFEICL